MKTLALALFTIGLYAYLGASAYRSFVQYFEEEKKKKKELETKKAELEASEVGSRESTSQESPLFSDASASSSDDMFITGFNNVFDFFSHYPLTIASTSALVFFIGLYVYAERKGKI